MRLVGNALFVAWLLAWLVAPKGEQARPTSTVGGLAITGDEQQAVAWLEVSHARPRSSEVLHVATVSTNDVVTPRLHLEARDDVAYRLADSGDGRFVLVSEHRNRLDRWFELRRFGDRRTPASMGAFAKHTASAPESTGESTGESAGESAGESIDRPENLRATFNASTWEVASAGDHVIVVEEEADGGETAVHVLDRDGQWLPAQSAGRTLVAASRGTLVRYEVGRSGDRVWVVPATGSPWSMEVTHPHCVVPPSARWESGLTPPPGAVAQGELKEKVLSVVPLPGGYARLVRLGNWLCGDGIRDGQHVSIAPTPIATIVDPKIIADAEGRILLTDGNEGKGSVFLERLERSGDAVPFAWAEHPLSVPPAGGSRGYAIVNVTSSGATALVTRATVGETTVLLRRFATSWAPPHGAAMAQGAPQPSSEVLLGPTRHFLPDHRKLLRVLSLAPLVALLLALGSAVGLLRRLGRLAPPPSSAPLPSGPVAIEAQLARDADAPAGALRVRRAGHPMLLVVDGAEVLRASDVRSRGEPRGDAVDVASGAAIVATGHLERGALFRGEDVLHAGRGDLVLVGCTLAEARTRVAARVATTAALLGGAITAIALLVR